MAAAWRRPPAWASAVALGLALLAGCSYAAEEPGLFPTPKPRTTSAGPPRERFQPQPTNPRLPVVGERLWTSGSSPLPITMRIAVHAVRRMPGATVLDWSITPVSAPGFGFGNSLPGTELGLVRPTSQNQPNVLLVDPGARTSYQPLTHKRAQEFNHCLCTPLWVVTGDLRVGETRLLQITYPALPASLTFVDVSFATVPPFWHVPVTPAGQAPVAARPTDLSRPGEVDQPAPGTIDFPNPSRSKQFQRIQVARVSTSPDRATLEWSLTSLDDQVRNRILDYEPPVAGVPPDGVEVVNFSPANGAVLRTGSARRNNSWAETSVNNRTAYECLCTEIGLWASGLRIAGVSAGLVTNYPALPPGTRTVDVEFPGFGVFRGVPVVPVEDAAARADRAEPADTGSWVYSTEDPPRGWATAEWPTDTPSPEQLTAYQGGVDRLVTLPAPR